MRRPRVHYYGAIFHIITRGIDRRQTFGALDDYEWFLKFIRATKERFPFRLFAFALMPNHIHLALQVLEIPTSRILQSLLTAYSGYFNHRHGRSGYVFQGRYKAYLCETDPYLLELVRYVHLNPIRARLAQAPEDWLWSGHREYLKSVPGGLIDAGPVLELIRGPQQYVDFLRQGMKDPVPEDWDPGAPAPFLRKDAPLPPRPKLLEDATGPESRPGLQDIVRRLAGQAGLTTGAVLSRAKNSHVLNCRDSFIAEAVSVFGYSPAEIARYLGCHISSVTRSLQRLHKTEEAEQAL